MVINVEKTLVVKFTTEWSLYEISMKKKLFLTVEHNMICLQLCSHSRALKYRVFSPGSIAKLAHVNNQILSGANNSLHHRQFVTLFWCNCN